MKHRLFWGLAAVNCEGCGEGDGCQVRQNEIMLMCVCPMPSGQAGRGLGKRGKR